MNKPHLGFVFVCMFSVFLSVRSQSSATDASVMQDLKRSLNPSSSLGWTDPDPCNWENVHCANDKRITKIQIGRKELTGSLPSNLNNLTALKVLEVQVNQLTGPLPSLSGLSSLQSIVLSDNNFSAIPSDFFNGMTSLQSVILDNNFFTSWAIPESLKSASTLQTFSAISANISGKIPDFLGPDIFVELTNLRLSFNYLEGGLPSSFSGSSVQTFWLNGQKGISKLNGTIDVLQNMTELSEVWLHGNSFSGPLPDFSKLKQLQNLSLRDNRFTGPVPASLVELPSLKVVNLTNNMLQGPTPKFNSSVQVDMNSGTNSFCSNDADVDCDPRVNTLLSIAEYVGYPTTFAENWKGNDPCTPWFGLACTSRDITVVNFPKMGLSGTIAPNFSSIASLQRLILASNNLTGTIPIELTTLLNLKELDVSNNQLYGKIPSFRSNVLVKTDGNVNIGKDTPPPTAPGTPTDNKPGSSGVGGTNAPGNGGKKSSPGMFVGSIVGGVCCAAVLFVVLFVWVYRAKRKRSGGVQYQNTMVIHPHHSGSDDAVKITVASSVYGGASETYSHGSSGPSDIHVVETGNMLISIQVLKNVTNNFSEENILGKGGFGAVYKGELHDGTKIAVKRMESGVMSEKGLDEFKSEITVLTKVRHRHLVALLGYCLDGNERLLVYEYMPQGTLSQHLFNWKGEGLTPLEWTRRLIIALDVARGVEYLHGLAQQSFIHRDLKPSNILLGDDMRAKVSDFGLVRLVDGKASVVTKLAGTFGYLAPEYAVTGRVTTKIDVYSFGVILMELITGRRALDETQHEESMHLVPWFRRMNLYKDSFQKAIDPVIDLDEETFASVTTVAELAGHCCAREPYQRPDMGHAVNVLSSLTELWKPGEPDPEDVYGIDYDMTLPQVVKKWKALEGVSGIDGSSSYLGSNNKTRVSSIDCSSSYLASSDNTQTSIPTRPSGLADTFASDDGR
ncbi:unnamed protein product [Ilex paraguariensis]|uniref:non-specific serine/threonine protein kinase n=1 Tax=Ilex paraguariensis TaxID=185542 RepID=A0ABC8RDV0_9AQUA